MVVINEWLPNPKGADASGEWIELFNTGNSAVDLTGWRVETKGGRKIKLKNQSIDSQGYLVLKRTETKLALRNRDEELSLYDNSGKLVDRSAILGDAPEGKSFSRFTLPSFGSQSLGGRGRFSFTEPTPGAANKFPQLQASLIEAAQPLGAELSSGLTHWDFLGLALGSAALLTALIIFVVKKNEDLSKLFFAGDEEIR